MTPQTLIDYGSKFGLTEVQVEEALKDAVSHFSLTCVCWMCKDLGEAAIDRYVKERGPRADAGDRSYLGDEIFITSPEGEGTMAPKRDITPEADDQNALEFIRWMTVHTDTFNLSHEKVALLRRFITRQELLKVMASVAELNAGQFHKLRRRNKRCRSPINSCDL